MPDRDDETGRYVADHPDEQFLEAIAGLGPTGTQDIADEVGCKYDTAYKRLRQLEEEGKVTRRKVGNANLWMLEENSNA